MLKFEAHKLSIDASFWNQLSKYKLETLRLDEKELLVSAELRKGGMVALEAISLQVDSEWGNKESVRAVGQFLLLNTKEAFVRASRAELLAAWADRLWADIADGSAFRDPRLLARFAVVAYGDLKRHVYHYHAAHPVYALPEDVAPRVVGKIDRLNKGHGATLEAAVGGMDDVGARQRMCVAALDEASVLAPLDRFEAGMGLFVVDSGEGDVPAWLARVALLAVATRLKEATNVRVVLWRGTGGESREFVARVGPVTTRPAKPVGWERSSVTAKLGSTLDPTRVAESAVRLNLELMRWRLAPDLKLEDIGAARCLIVGAGTLGCNIARGLLGWGVRRLTFVDSGRVSYSNPARQSLFVHEDALGGGQPKAVAAAAALARISPGVEAEAEVLAVPMPGHPCDRDSYARFDALVREHDVVFLGLDSREGRWLPTVLAQVHGRLLINAALGFDSYVVQRHGLPPAPGLPPHLACYFCSDVVAPRDSLKERSLDMQCTVSRPGVSMLAAAAAVEVFAAVLQHPLGPRAPADSSTTCLGVTPHQIRGFLSTFQVLNMASPPYDCCSACSVPIVAQISTHGVDFMEQVSHDPTILENISGLSKLSNDTLILQEDDFDGFSIISES